MKKPPRVKLHLNETDRKHIVDLYEKFHSSWKVRTYMRAWHGLRISAQRILLVLREEGVVAPRRDGSTIWRQDHKGYYVRFIGRGKEGANHSGCVFLHRLVAEEKIGRKIRPDEVAHHRNGEPSDNRPENLMVVTRKAHRRIHAILRRLERDYRAKCEEEGTPLNEGVSLRFMWEAWHVAYVDPYIDEWCGAGQDDDVNKKDVA